MRRQKWRYYHSMDDHDPITPQAKDHHVGYKEMTDEDEECFDRGIVHTYLPSRLDMLPFGAYHWFLVVCLGITWVLDGLEVTILSVVSANLKREDTLGLTDIQVGLAASASLFGAILGSLVFGYLCDRFGRRKLYLATPLVYSVATGLSAFCWEFYGFALLRFITGAGLGGEYSAINSAIDELIPAKVRGHVDLAVNGSYWFGAAIAAALSLYVLDPSFLGPPDLGWRFMFAIGALLGVGIIVARLFLPESPRWLMTHGQLQEAEAVVKTIELKSESWNARLQASPLRWLCGANKGQGSTQPSQLHQYFSSSEYEAVEDGRDMEDDMDHVSIIPRKHTPLREVFHAILVMYPSRSALSLILMIAQAFFYNAIFFSYALILVDFHGVPSDQVGLYLLPFALGNFLGPLTLGRLFDTVGRRKMISLTYSLAAVLLLITGWLFEGGLLGAATQTIMWSLVFYVASPAASAAYLTVSEVFPLEIRALAISVFYSLGTGIGGVIAPTLFGWLLQMQRADSIFYGYAAAAALMLIAALSEAALGVDAERKSLESITAPLSALRTPPPSSTASGLTSLASSSSFIFPSQLPPTPSSSFGYLPPELSYPATGHAHATTGIQTFGMRLDDFSPVPSLSSSPATPSHNSSSTLPTLSPDETEYEASDAGGLVVVEDDASDLEDKHASAQAQQPRSGDHG